MVAEPGRRCRMRPITFSPAASRWVPGDVVWMGTDDPTLDMVPGQVVEVELDGIGALRNPVEMEV